MGTRPSGSRCCQGCGASAGVIPLSRGWAPHGGATAAVLASPRGAGLCHHHGWHCPAWLYDAASHQPAAVSHLSLPPRGTLVAHSRGDFKGHEKHPSPLGFPDGPDHMEAASWPSPRPAHCSWSPEHHRYVTHKSPGPSQTKPAVTHPRERSIALPVPMGAGLLPPWWP